MGYGIDIGSSAVKVVALGRTLRGLRIVGATRRRIPKVAPADQKGEIARLLRDALGSSNGRRAGVVGLSGRDINLQVMQQPSMKPLNYRVMMGYELDQRRGSSGDLYADYCTLREPDPYFPQYLALVGIGKSSYIDDRLSLLTAASVDAHDAVPNAFALYAAYRHSYGRESGTVMLLDIGSDNMDIAFAREGRLIFARNVSSGARVFDGNVAGMAGTTPEEAEYIKIKMADLEAPLGDDDESEEERLRAPIRTAAGQLAGFINASINHAKLQLNDKDLVVDKFYLSGGGARLKGLLHYLSGALKIPGEALDPFLRLDCSVVDALGDGDFKTLPTDMAVAVGLAHLATSPGEVASLSILPEPLKIRKTRLRNVIGFGGAGVVLATTLLILTVLAVARKSGQEGELARFTEKTAEVSKRIAEMDALEQQQRETSAKLDYLTSHTWGGRGALDIVGKLRRILPPGMTIREVRLVHPAGGRDERSSRGGVEIQRLAFHVKGKGLVLGEREDETDAEIRLKGHSEPYPKGDIAGDIERWTPQAKSVLVVGEIDENIRGGAREALNALKDQLSDASRGVKAAVQSQKGSDKPGWRTFEIGVSFE